MKINKVEDDEMQAYLTYNNFFLIKQAGLSNSTFEISYEIKSGIYFRIYSGIHCGICLGKSET